MYTKFFGLNEKPFSITPDPRYLYMSRRHADALAHLLYGISESGGFIQLTGEVGTGKTTLVRSMLERLPEQADVAVVLNPQLSTVEFLQTICEELGAPLPPAADSTKALVDSLNWYLLQAHARGRRTILIVDEAQNLSPEVLEQVRLLTNLETSKQKLLQIILIGQPELRELLERTDMRQLAQRITGRYHLEPLSKEEGTAYLRHRLKVAGSVAQIFDERATQEIVKLSKGVPRIMNVIADRSLLAAYTRDSRTVTRSLVRRAAAEVSGRLVPSGLQRATVSAIALAGITMVALGVWRAIPAFGPSPSTALLNRADALETNVLENVLIEERGGTNTDSAFSTLFELWNMRYRSGDTPACEQALTGGLACLFQQGSWNHLRRLNRPAILTLTNHNGVEYQVVLNRLDDRQAELIAGERKYLVSLDELSDYWFGDHLILWRPPGAEPKALSPGMRDEAIPWLRRSLATINGADGESADPLLYDENLEAVVREYQRERRLTVDGLVGAQTQIVINTDLGLPDTPMLTFG